MEELNKIQDLLSNKDDFRIEDIFKLFDSMSSLYNFQGRVLTKLL